MSDKNLLPENSNKSFIFFDFSSESIKRLIFFFASFIVLTLGFYSNTWKTVEDKEFNDFQLYSESLVIGRLIVAEDKGFFAYGALTGWVKGVLKDKNQVDAQYEIYKNNINTKNARYWVYKSQIGAQASVFALLDRVSPYKNATNLKIFRLITALLTALCFSFFLLWIAKDFNISVSALTLIFILLSGWLAVFGKNLWWQLWSFYVPFLALLFLLQRESKNENRKITAKTLFLVSFISVFIKTLFSGMEYISASLVMLTIPLFYYAVITNQKFITLFKRLINVTAASISAILLSFFILAYQISIPEGSLSKGFEHIIFSFLKRTSGNSADFQNAFKKSLDASVFEVLEKYWNSIAFDFSVRVNFEWESLLKIDFGELILIFMFFSALLFLSKNIMPSNETNIKQNKALSVATWISLAAPVSWFVIFKGHSYIHTHMNSIVWYMPFALFGFIIISQVIVSAANDAFTKIKNLSSIK